VLDVVWDIISTFPDVVRVSGNSGTRHTDHEINVNLGLAKDKLIPIANASSR
jgi:hypothetical protein